MFVLIFPGLMSSDFYLCRRSRSVTAILCKKKKMSPVGLKSHDLLRKGESEHLDDVKVEALKFKS